MLGVQAFFEEVTHTVSYIVFDEATKYCAVIDPVLDYDLISKQTATHSADALIAYINKMGLTLEWILETHVHADHLTAAYYLKQKLGGKIGIGSGVLEVLEYWAPKLENSEAIPLDGSQFDCLFEDNVMFKLGDNEVKVLHTPGHTPACVSYLIDDAIFVGDLIFMPYMGTGRVDFPGGSAETSYTSIQRLFALPEATKVFIGHDYPEEGCAPSWESTVGIQKNENVLIHNGISKEKYLQIRNERDVGKGLPRLFYPSIQANLCRGSHQGSLHGVSTAAELGK